MKISDVPSRRASGQQVRRIAPPSVWLDRPLRPVLIAAIAILFGVFCARVWAMGPMHSDDAFWVLWSSQPGVLQHVAADARAQARLWFFVSAPQVLFGLHHQGGLLGQGAQYGSFLLFCASFYAMISRFFSLRIALLAATLFVAWTAVQLDGSVLITYPIYTWTSGAAFMLSALLAQLYCKTGIRALLIPIAVLFTFSIVIQEGVCALFVVLFPALLLFDARDAIRHQARAGFGRSRLLQLFALWGVCVLAYAIPYVIWRATHQTTYGGVSLAKFDLGKILAVLVSFVGSGSAIGDLVKPYHVTYVDAVSGMSHVVAYGPQYYVAGLLTDAKALVILLMVAATSFILLTNGRLARSAGIEGLADAAPPAGSPLATLVFAILFGLFMALTPMAPVAMTRQYQDWHFNSGVTAHSHTIFTQFGLSVASSAAVLAAFAAIERNRPAVVGLAAAITALAIGALASLSSRSNDQIVADVRPEGYRWQALHRILPLATFMDPEVNYVLAPQLRSGSWYAAMPPDYWTSYVRTRLHSNVTVLDHTRSDFGAHAALAEYRMSPDGRSADILVSRLGARDGKAVVTQVAVALAKRSSSVRSGLFLTYRDLDGRSQAKAIDGLAPMPGDPTVRTLAGMRATPGSVLIYDRGFIDPVALSCPDALAPLAGRDDVYFGTDPQPGHPKSCPHATDGDAWFPPEPLGVWGRGRLSSLTLTGAGWGRNTVRLDLHLSSYAGMGFAPGDQTVTVRAHGAVLGRQVLHMGMPDQVMALTLPEAARDAPDKVKLDLEIDHPLSPAEIAGPKSDTRSLGVYLRSLQVEVEGGGP